MYLNLMIVLDPFTHALTIYCIFHTGLVAGADMIEFAKRVKKRRNHREKLKAVEKANRNVPVRDGMIPRPGIIAPHTTVMPLDIIPDTKRIVPGRSAIPATKKDNYTDTQLQVAKPAPKLFRPVEKSITKPLTSLPNEQSGKHVGLNPGPKRSNA
jgi:hypothetical protein